jgi:hypothetical protein
LTTAALSQRRDALGRFQPAGGRRQCAESGHPLYRDRSDAPQARSFIVKSKIDQERQISYLQTMIGDVPTFVSAMMMPLSFLEAEPFDM